MTKKIRNILYLCADSGIPFWGTKGGSIHMREIVRCLALKNSVLTVVAKGASGYPGAHPGFNTIDLPEPRLGDILNVLNDIAVDDQLAGEFADLHRNAALEELLDKIYAEDKFDIIYERYSLFNLAGLRFSRKYKIPHVLEVNAPLVREASEYRRLSLLEIARAIEKYLFAGSDHIIAVSEELRGYIEKLTPGRPVTVVPNGVRVDHFISSGEGRTGEDSGRFIVGFLGSMKPWHGVEILIKSFAELAAKSDDCHLLLIGDNRKRGEDLSRMCADLRLNGKVTFTGAVEYDMIPGMLQRADVLVAPYPEMDDFYFSALKVFEYMAAGKAIVASNIGQLSRILTHEKTALLTRPGDTVSLRNALARLKDDPHLRRRLGDNARIAARTRHTWAQRADSILRIIENLEGGRS